MHLSSQAVVSAAQTDLAKKDSSKKAGKAALRFASLLKKDGEPAAITLDTLSEIDLNRPLEKADLAGVMDEIHLLGKKMNDSRGMSDLMAYKEAVQKFIHLITARNYRVQKKHYSVPNRFGAQKELTLIHTIDAKLEALGMEFLSLHKKNLNLLQEVDEIQGLLFDLVA